MFKTDKRKETLFNAAIMDGFCALLLLIFITFIVNINCITSLKIAQLFILAITVSALLLFNIKIMFRDRRLLDNLFSNNITFTIIYIYFAVVLIMDFFKKQVFSVIGNTLTDTVILIIVCNIIIALYAISLKKGDSFEYNTEDMQTFDTEE